MTFRRSLFTAVIALLALGGIARGQAVTETIGGIGGAARAEQLLESIGVPQVGTIFVTRVGLSLSNVDAVTYFFSSQVIGCPTAQVSELWQSAVTNNEYAISDFGLAGSDEITTSNGTNEISGGSFLYWDCNLNLYKTSAATQGAPATLQPYYTANMINTPTLPVVHLFKTAAAANKNKFLDLPPFSINISSDLILTAVANEPTLNTAATIFGDSSIGQLSTTPMAAKLVKNNLRVRICDAGEAGCAEAQVTSANVKNSLVYNSAGVFALLAGYPTWERVKHLFKMKCVSPKKGCVTTFAQGALIYADNNNQSLSGQPTSCFNQIGRMAYVSYSNSSAIYGAYTTDDIAQMQAGGLAGNYAGACVQSSQGPADVGEVASYDSTATVQTDANGDVIVADSTYALWSTPPFTAAQAWFDALPDGSGTIPALFTGNPNVGEYTLDITSGNAPQLDVAVTASSYEQATCATFPGGSWYAGDSYNNIPPLCTITVNNGNDNLHGGVTVQMPVVFTIQGSLNDLPLED